ncbi:hypothetical protein [Sphingomonas arenae]|uniref:hypothetical protein n=1 Tax=Sphingomonas arenae TaxID=2812555 RepID=UPI0019686269|nr:hypothetical protein [Sphingomonas arenae]
MNYKKLGFGLGIFSIGLGAFEIAAPGRIARALGLDEDGPARKTIFAFGLREIAAGVALLRGPAVSTNVWNRVIGDTLDLGALVLALGSSNKPRAVAGALAFVGSATALDVYTARGLDEQTGRTFTTTHGQSDLAPA